VIHDRLDHTHRVMTQLVICSGRRAAGRSIRSYQRRLDLRIGACVPLPYGGVPWVTRLLDTHPSC
jgi:hypothetical protein